MWLNADARQIQAICVPAGASRYTLRNQSPMMKRARIAQLLELLGRHHESRSVQSLRETCCALAVLGVVIFVLPRGIMKHSE
jgi:hypothetical protein